MEQGKKTRMTPLQRLFVAEYLKDKNGAAAAKRAGYTGEYLDRQAHALQKQPEIAKAIERGIERQVKVIENDADKILRELIRLGYSDIRRIFKEDGTVAHPKDWPTEIAHAVQSIEVEELFEGTGAERTWVGYTKKVKFWPKDKALELLGKNKKLFTDVRELKADESLSAILAASWGPKKEGEPS